MCVEYVTGVGCTKCGDGYYLYDCNYQCIPCSKSCKNCQQCKNFVGCQKCIGTDDSDSNSNSNSNSNSGSDSQETSSAAFELTIDHETGLKYCEPSE